MALTEAEIAQIKQNIDNMSVSSGNSLSSAFMPGTNSLNHFRYYTTPKGVTTGPVENTFGPRVGTEPPKGVTTGTASTSSSQPSAFGWDNMDSTRRDWFKSQGYTPESFNENIIGANAAYEQANKGTDWGMQGYGGLALGAGQLGLGLASYFDQRGVAKKQKELLGQQVANNRTEMAARANYRDALAKNF